MPVDVSRCGGRRGDLRKLQRWARRLLANLGLSGSELSIVLCDDAFIQPLNLRWRQKDCATDVLSFPQDEGPGPVILGDVVISVQTAAKQAKEVGHRVEDELKVLLVHGLCHLLGHDHQDRDASQAMARQERVLLDAIDGGGALGLVHRGTEHWD